LKNQKRRCKWREGFRRHYAERRLATEGDAESSDGGRNRVAILAGEIHGYTVDPDDFCLAGLSRRPRLQLADR
jgi:hypothetical protein